MDPASLALLGLNAVMGISGGITARADIYARNQVNAANTYARNLVRGSTNELTSKRGSLARFNQSVNNQRTLQAAGSAQEAAIVNYRRARDSATKDSFEGQVKFAEQAGAQVAAAAHSGLTGGVADLVAATTSLRKSRIQQAVDQSLKQGDYDAAKRNRAILVAGWDSLDHSEITDQLDYGKDVATTSVYGGNLFSEMIKGQTGQTLRAGFEFASQPFSSSKADPLDSFFIN